MGFKETLLKFAGPGGWIAASALKLKAKLKRKPKTAAAVAAVGGAAVGAAASSAPAPAPIYAAPPGRGMWHNQIVQALLFLVAGATGYYLMNKLGLKWWFDASMVLAFGVLLALMRFAQFRDFGARIFKIIALVGGGVIGFIALAMLPFPLPHVFTTAFLIFYIISVFAIWGKKNGFMVLLFNLAIFIPLIFTNMFITVLVPGTPIYNAVEGQQESWDNMFEGFKKLGAGAVKGVEREFFYAFSDDFTYGVEAESEKPLGVFLENVGITSKFVTEKDTVDVYATLRVESFKTEEPLKIKVRCYEAGFEDDKDKAGQIIPVDEFFVQEYEIQEIDCIMKAVDLGIGPHNVVLDATFEFTTSAYLKGYFMEQDRIRALRREQLDPLGSFGITDTNPLAVFTGGPLSIGMKVGQQPIAIVSKELFDYGPTLSITYDRNWFEGELAEISKLIITVPPGLRIGNIDGKNIEQYCKFESTQEHTCTITDEQMLEKLFSKEKNRPISTPKINRVSTIFKDPAMILAGAPLAIRSFKVNIGYTYRIKKQIGVNVRREKVV